MTGYLHLLRTAVQIQDIKQLVDVQSHFGLTTQKYGDVVVASTKRMPTRRDEVLDGGSMYWIVKNRIQCRQRILDLRMKDEDTDSSYCQILLDPEITRVSPRPKRAIQGWRYLQGWDAPRDLGPYTGDADDDLPDELEAELRDMGVL